MVLSNKVKAGLMALVIVGGIHIGTHTLLGDKKSFKKAAVNEAGTAVAIAAAILVAMKTENEPLL